MKKILAFRTDRLGDFIITKQSLNLFLSNEQYEVDIVASPKNYEYIKNFKSFNKIYIFEGSYINFFIKNYDILKKKYDYIILYDGKKRSHIISFFLKGKKISLSKSKKLFKIANFFNYISIFNSDYTVQLENFDFINLILEKKNLKANDFYFDYKFEKLAFKLPAHDKKNFILHLDEKWFKGYYYHDFDYCEWDSDFFLKLIKIINKNFNIPIIITTGIKEIPFINKIKKEFFFEVENNIFKMRDLSTKVFLVDNLSFRQLEALIKIYSKYILCCEGGISHVSDNLNIKTFAMVQSGRFNFYKHWTYHMKNIVLLERGNQKKILKYVEKLKLDNLI